MCVWGCVCECVSKTHTNSLTGKMFEPLFKSVLTHTVIKIQVYPRCARNCSTDKYVFLVLCEYPDTPYKTFLRKQLYDGVYIK